MSELILHHYPTSPFAEKIRTVLGYKKLAWKSVIIPRIMPKPDVVALTGGYRRTPLLQIGADIYCDTALICDVLEHRQNTPSLYPQGSTGAVRIVAQWADSTLFWAAMGYSFSPPGAAYMFKDQSPEEAKAFAEDRAKMRAGGTRMYPTDATSAYKSYLRRIASMVDEQPFVLGKQPSVADFSCYHALWFTKRIAPLAGIFDATPSLAAWMGRMAAFGHGSTERVQFGRCDRAGGEIDAGRARQGNIPGRPRHRARQQSHHHRRELRPRSDRGRTRRRHAHALQPAPQRPARRHRACALSAHRLSAARGEGGVTERGR